MRSADMVHADTTVRVLASEVLKQECVHVGLHRECICGTSLCVGPRQHAAVVVTWCSLLIGCGLWLPFTLGRYVLLAAAPLLPKAPPPALLHALLGHPQARAPAPTAAQALNATQARPSSCLLSSWLQDIIPSDCHSTMCAVHAHRTSS